MQNRKNTRIHRITKKAVSLIMAGIMAASFSACGRDSADTTEPATSRAPIDHTKTARNLVKQAEDGAVTDSNEIAKQGDYTTDGASVQEGQAANMKELEHMKTTFSSENGLLNIEVDAPVLIPECDAYPILSVKRGTIDDALLKKAKELLLGDTQLYDGVRLLSPDIEAALSNGEKPDPMWKIKGQVPYSEIVKYPVEVQLSKVSELSKDYSEVEEFSDYYESLMKDGDLFYGVTDGKDGTYANLCVTNSRRYGSSLKFFRSKDYNVRSGLVLPGLNIYSWPVEEGKDYLYDEVKNPTMPIGLPSKMTEIKMENGETEYVGDGKVDPDFTGCKTTDSETETNNLTRDEAIRQAEELLQRLGLQKDYALAASMDEFFTDPQHITSEKDADGKYGYEFLVGRAWHLVFQRGVNGNLVENYGEKYTYHGEKKIWSGEVIEVFMNDNGIIGLAISDPLTVNEVVVENGKLLSFEEIRRIYEASQLEALNHSTSFDSILSVSAEDAEKTGEGRFTFKIDQISLRYVLISEKNEYERGLLVPVWSFEGICYDIHDNTYAKGSLLQINAVDGTVYNAQLGY
ncbi:MAG: hypothetical protein IKN79_01120 [Eubacterium sp.]|nr:hypothetical protein [Eubacterium sp.]